MSVLIYSAEENDQNVGRCEKMLQLCVYMLQKFVQLDEPTIAWEALCAANPSLDKALIKGFFQRSNYSFYNGDLKMCKMFPEISHPVTSCPLHRFVAELYLLLAASKVL